MTARVLIVDDSLVARTLLSRQLAPEGYELAEADDGHSALASCRHTRPDLMLLDIAMPGMTGFEVLETLQGDPDLVGIPVLVVSGLVGADNAARALQLGAHDYLRKPVATDELLARITAALRTSAAPRRPEPVAAEPAVAPPAKVDAVTGVLAIRELQHQFEDLARASRDEGMSLGGVLVDVQHLDEINEAHGRAAGDAVLHGIADLAQSHLGNDDVIGRCGPDELLVLLPHSSLGAARMLADRLRRGVRTAAFGDDHDVHARISTGAAVSYDGNASQLLIDLQDAIEVDDVPEDLATVTRLHPVLTFEPDDPWAPIVLPEGFRVDGSRVVYDEPEEDPRATPVAPTTTDTSTGGGAGMLDLVDPPEPTAGAGAGSRRFRLLPGGD